MSEYEFKDYRAKPLIKKALRLTCSQEIFTLECTMKAEAGDWLIMGIKGELYPCKDDIFRESYEEVKNEP